MADAAIETKSPTDALIFKAATTFREAIERAGADPWSRQTLTFPKGACGHAAELLGRYLIQKFGISPDYVNQTVGHDLGGWTDSHTWLEWNGLTIDITGDQFGWEPVIVTRTPVYHGQGLNEVRQPACSPELAAWWALNCGALWTVIAQHLPHDEQTRLVAPRPAPERGGLQDRFQGLHTASPPTGGQWDDDVSDNVRWERIVRRSLEK